MMIKIKYFAIYYIVKNCLQVLHYNHAIECIVFNYFSFWTDLYLDKILSEILEWLEGKEVTPTMKKMKGIPVMTAQQTELPNSVSKQGVDFIHGHRPQIVKAVKLIVMDGVKEVHSNGDTKLWGVSLLNLLRLSLAAKEMNPQGEWRILDWEASIEGEYKFNMLI